MKFLFLDESKKQGKIFNLVGLMINKDNLLKLEKSLEELKKKHKLSNLKDLKGPIRNKLGCTKEIVAILIENDVKIISSILGPIALKNKAKIDDNYFEAITFLIERFFINLKRENKHGFIIHDSIGKSIENDLTKQVYNYIKKEEMKLVSKNLGFFRDRIYPSLLFSKDDYSNILQVADLVSTSLHSAVYYMTQLSDLRVDEEKLKEYNPFLELYWPLFMKDSSNQVSGWGIKVWW